MGENHEAHDRSGFRHACLAVFAGGLLASGCDWAQLGFDSSHAGYNQFDTTITPANVSTLVAHFSATDGTTGTVTPQAVVNGILYASNATGIKAYSARRHDRLLRLACRLLAVVELCHRVSGWQLECAEQQHRCC